MGRDQQQMILNPLGIVTTPNKMGLIPAGGMSIAENALVRAPGTLDIASTWVTRSSTMSGVYWQPVFASDTYVLIVARTTAGTAMAWWWWNKGTNALQFSNSSSLYVLDVGGRYSVIRVRDRTIVTTTRTPAVFDYVDPALGSFPRTSGLWVGSAAFNSNSLGADATDGSIKPMHAVQYVVISRRKYADGYELVSPPSWSFHVVNSSATLAATPNLTMIPAGTALAGDVMELYRTRSQPWTNTTATNTGSDYYKVGEYVLTGNTGFNVTDTCSDSQLGDALYTNAGAGGTAAEAAHAPTARCAASFRGHAFYGNITNPPELTLSFPLYLGLISSTAPDSVRRGGIGRRGVTGTLTIGSPTVTAVSASHVLGLVIGQEVDLPTFVSPGTTIIAVGANSFTMSSNALNSSVGNPNFLIYDVLEISGLPIDVETMASLRTLVGNFWVSQYNNAYSTLGFTQSTLGVYPIDGMRIVRWQSTAGTASTITARATNGNNYVPRLPRIEAGEAARTYSETVVPNLIRWSEQNQPENCPEANSAFVGRGTIYGMASTRDALWIFASDGLWRLSGTGGAVGAEGYDWRIDPVDVSIVICGPQAFTVLNDIVYAYTNQGFVSIDSAGSVTRLSESRCREVMPPREWSLPAFTPSSSVVLEAYPAEDEVWIRMSTDPTQVYVYSVRADVVTTLLPSLGGAVTMSAFCYDPTLQEMVAVGANVPTQTLGFVTLNNSVDLADLRLVYQPVYGEHPFAIYHWQDAQVVVEADIAGPTSVNMSANGVAMGTAPIAATSPGVSEFTRVTQSVPLNAPAAANNLQLTVQVPTNAVNGRIRLQGIAVRQIPITTQRKVRR